MHQSIINDVNIGDAYTKPVPAKATQQLRTLKDSLKFNECDFDFNYWSVVDKYSSDPRKEHGEAIVYIVRYLKKTCHLGLKFRPNESTGSECYCDADFACKWNKDFAQHDPSMAKSRGGWFIFYARCPIIWSSATIPSSTLHHRGGVHCHVYGLTRCYSPHGTHEQITGKRLQGHLYSTPSLLQGL
eukprot:CCRYP_006519-RA/>CCRYP_006519-RA protein AED:0.24 eAED:0.25 QI:0/0/0/1/1/1/2/0/185